MCHFYIVIYNQPWWTTFVGHLQFINHQSSISDIIHHGDHSMCSNHHYLDVHLQLVNAYRLLALL